MTLGAVMTELERLTGIETELAAFCEVTPLPTVSRRQRRPKLWHNNNTTAPPNFLGQDPLRADPRSWDFGINGVTWSGVAA